MDTDTAEHTFSFDRYAALTGVELVEAGKGYCKTRLPIKDKHLNAANVVQGGAIFTLADVAFAVASNSHGPLDCQGLAVPDVSWPGLSGCCLGM